MQISCLRKQLSLDDFIQTDFNFLKKKIALRIEGNQEIEVGLDEIIKR